MIFEQHYLDCLSQASYVIGDQTTGRAVVVDPRRDVAAYLESASEHGLTIELVIETHFHADFLSGHLELADATGAEIAYGAAAEVEFASRMLADGERIELGDVVLEIRHTPGHTPESISIVVYDEGTDAPPYGVLTGDTMFIGDVGRPDLLSSVGVTAEDLAGSLYDSLHDQLLTLPDETRVFPGHGAGSACGKNLSTETSSTIGEQRRTNYALAPMTKVDFIGSVTDGQGTAPAYFAYDAARNRQDRELLHEHEPPAGLDLAALDTAVAGGAMVVDGRDPVQFAHGHMLGSVNVGLAGRYAEFAGSVVPSDVDIVLVVDPGDELEAKNRLARIGFDRVVGHLVDPAGVMAANPDRTQIGSRLTAAAYIDDVRGRPGLQLVDVRGPGEFASGTIDHAICIPVGQLPSRVDELDPTAETVVYCAGGYRSSVAASVLREAGFADVSDIMGGYGAWQAAVAPA